MKLGPFELQYPFILAPMAGITHSPFRRVMRHYGASLVISELVSASGITYQAPRTLQLLNFHEEERPVGLQIFGENVEHLCFASQWIEKQGADFVDLNLGCPVTKVVKKGAGAAMCCYPQALFKVLKAIVQSVRLPVTIKIRTGWDDQHQNAHEIVKVATEAGIAWVSVHGRTRAQGYQGQANWDLIGEIKARSQIPIIGNGDIQTPQQAIEKLKTYAVDAVMVGRGVLRRPFLLQQAGFLWEKKELKSVSPEDLLQWIRYLRFSLEDYYTPVSAVIHSRKFLAWLSTGFEDCHRFRKQLFEKNFSEVDLDLFWKETEEFFSQRTPMSDKKNLSGDFLMGGHG